MVGTPRHELIFFLLITDLSDHSDFFLPQWRSLSKISRIRNQYIPHAEPSICEDTLKIENLQTFR